MAEMPNSPQRREYLVRNGDNYHSTLHFTYFDLTGVLEARDYTSGGKLRG